ncbi:hypothetical protein L3V83_13265 [Thiotrichales bacterium 19X7-9]|nr:hypothetical protein [Thiotrichales bacterium 19X7-9]
MNSVIFHDAYNLLLKEVKNNHVFVKIVDLLNFRISGSKYEEDGKRFFLMPNIEKLAGDSGCSTSTVKRALDFFKEQDWIISKRRRCADGAVRMRYFTTKKFDDLMQSVRQLTTKRNHDNSVEKDNGDSQCNLKKSDQFKMSQSDQLKMNQSYIKEQNIKDNKYINNSNQVTVVEEKEEEPVKVKSVNFELDLNDGGDGFIFAKNLAESYDLDLDALLMTLSNYYETNLYSCIDDLVADAITALRRIDRKEEDMPKFYAKLQPKKATFHAEDQRQSVLTPLQQVAISQLLHDLQSTGKASITNFKEVFAWMEYQVVNHDHHFVGKPFKHVLHIIKNLLCKSGKQQYSKPHGFQSAF